MWSLSNSFSFSKTGTSTFPLLTSPDSMVSIGLDESAIVRWRWKGSNERGRRPVDKANACRTIAVRHRLTLSLQVILWLVVQCCVIPDSQKIGAPQCNRTSAVSSTAASLKHRAYPTRSFTTNTPFPPKDQTYNRLNHDARHADHFAPPSCFFSTLSPLCSFSRPLIANWVQL